MTRPKRVPGEKPLFWTGDVETIGRRLNEARADYEVRYAKEKK